MAIVLCCAYSFVVYGSGTDTDDDRRTWSYSDLVGSLPDTAPTVSDDFYLNINYDWISANQDVTYVDSAIYNMTVGVYADIHSLGETNPDDPDYMLYAAIVSAYNDLDLRDTIGTDELMPYIQGLIDAEDLDGLTDYLVSRDCVLADPLLSTAVYGLERFDSDYVVFVGHSSLSLSPTIYQSDEFQTQMGAYEDLYGDLLSLMGYSDEEVAAMNDAATALEVEIALSVQTISSLDDSYNPYTVDELEAASPNFPILGILESMGFDEDEYSIVSPEWLATMNALYSEENFEGLRSLILRNTLAVASQFMGGEFLQTFLDMHETDLTTALFNYIWNQDSALLALMNTVYSNNFSNPEAEAVVLELFAQLKEVFRQHLMDAEWMDDETRAYALEKLDAMTIHVGGPRVVDFSGLTLPSTEGAGPLSDFAAIRSYYLADQAALAGTEIDSPFCTIQSYTVNAVHQWLANNIIVTWAFLQDGYYYESDASQESLLGRLGTVIGHEMTHGFDTTGSQYAADGGMYDWWSEESAEAFLTRSESLAEYISGITLIPDRTMDPSVVINEVIADMGGMSLVLDLASTMEGFDFELMFREYAEIWRTVGTHDYDLLTQSDEHPPACARVNMTVQQFQQFHDAFGVTEGDGMYLAPEDRVAIW